MLSGMRAEQARPHWLVFLQPRWLAFHAVGVIGIGGMLWLGLWQFHRAESGNELSWAYTFEWPLFAIFAVYFWVKSVRDELRLTSEATGQDADARPVSTAAPAGNGARAANGPSASAELAASAGSAASAERAESAADGESADAYLQRLMAEVQRHGKWRGWR